MEDMTVKTESSDYTELDDPLGLSCELSCNIPIKPDPDQPPAECGSTRLIAADSPSSTLLCNSAEVKPWFGDESYDVPTCGCTKDVPGPPMCTNHSRDSMCGEVIGVPTPRPSRSAAKRKFHNYIGDCTGLPHQVDPIALQYEVDTYDSGDVIVNDPLKPDPDEPSAEHGPSCLGKVDPIRSNALSNCDEVKKNKFHDDPCMASMDTNDSCVPEYDDVAEDSTKLLVAKEPVPKESPTSGILGAGSDPKMIGKSSQSTSVPRGKSCKSLQPISGASAKPLRIIKASGEEPYACDECDYRTALANNLKRHMAIHTGNKPYACNVCDFRSSWASALKFHVATHTGLKPYACDECDYRTVLAANLKRHMATHTGKKPFACDVCDFRSARACTLKRHMATHTGNKPYTCDLCDFRTSWPLSLKSHMATHTDDKPYACDSCGYRAAQASHLRFHMASHTGKKPYACGVCHYRAAQSSDLKRHMIIHVGKKVLHSRMMLSDADKLMSEPSHQADPIVAHDEADPLEPG